VGTPSNEIYLTMQWPKLVQGTLIKRYKRFLADIKLEDGQVITAHCPNSGSMRGCSEPGRTVYLSRSDSPNRRYPYTWELIEMPSSLVCVNTLVANRLMRKATIERAIGSLSEYRFVRTEVKCFESSRLDILLENPAGQLCFLEIKSCTQVEDEIAYFPDAVTIRGRKHLCDLQRQVNLGNRAMILFLIQRTDSRLFRPADHIDPAYGDELRLAVQNRVQIQVYDVDLTLQYIRPNNQIPWEL
jgi:sugar fermentation stimulation protein A